MTSARPASHGPGGSRSEWRNFWYLPLTAAIGYSTAVLPTYSMGAFMGPLEQAFGWSRAQISFGTTIFSISAAITTAFTGYAVDRFGPRKIALIGVPLATGAYALLGTATGSFANWVLLWIAVAILSTTVQATVWTSAVVSRFEASRGLALALTLSGGSLSAAVLPLVTTLLIGHFGWRGGFIGIGLIWAAIVYPLTLLLFRGARDGAPGTRAQATADAMALPGLTLAEALRTTAFYKLSLAGALFAFCIVGATVHFAPILIRAGASPTAAAGTASLIGIFAIVGRLGTGVVLDRFPGHLVGAVAFMIPVPACALLLMGGAGVANQLLAAAMFGLALGAEIDLIAYLATRHFGQKNYGVILGASLSMLALGAGLGPLGAGAIFDSFDNYTPFLILSAVMMTTGAALMAWMGTPPSDVERS